VKWKEAEFGEGGSISQGGGRERLKKRYLSEKKGGGGLKNYQKKRGNRKAGKALTARGGGKGSGKEGNEKMGSRVNFSSAKTETRTGSRVGKRP